MAESEAANTSPGRVEILKPNTSEFPPPCFQQTSFSGNDEEVEIVTDEEFEEPLSPIVGYTFSDDSAESSGSSTDPEARRLLNELNYMAFKTTPRPDSPTAKARKKQIRKRRRAILRKEFENTIDDSSSSDEDVVVLSSQDITDASPLMTPTGRNKANKFASVTVNTLDGFQASSGVKDISASAEAVKKPQAVQVNSDIEITDGSDDDVVVLSNPVIKDTSPLMTSTGGKKFIRIVRNTKNGFAALRDKNIFASDEAIKKSQKIRVNSEMEITDGSDVEFLEEVPPDCPVSLFLSAIGVNIPVSAKPSEKILTIEKDTKEMKKKLQGLSKNKIKESHMKAEDLWLLRKGGKQNINYTPWETMAEHGSTDDKIF